MNINQASTGDKLRISELDVLRGFAAIAVMLYHYTIVYPATMEHGDYQQYLPYGVYAVHLFFMISGFVIFMTLERTRTALDFIVSRFSRLYPVFWAAVLLSQTVVWLSPPSSHYVSWTEALVNMTMLGELFHVRLVDNVYWSLVIELNFYLIMLGLYVAGWLKHIERLVIPWLLLQLLAIGPAKVMHYTFPSLLAVAFLLKYAHLFFAGILCYRIRFQGQTTQRLVLLGACLVTQFFVQGISAGCVSLIFFGLFVALAKNWLGWLAVRPLVFLGTISYGLYLVHQNIGYVVMNHLQNYPRIVQVLAAETTVVILATALTFLIEKPAMKTIRNIYKRDIAK